MIDITDLKRVEEQLRRSEARFRDFAEAAGERDCAGERVALPVADGERDSEGERDADALPLALLDARALGAALADACLSKAGARG